MLNLPNPHRSSYPTKGFTLIELLVVIGIIGILATVLVTAINPVAMTARARDTQRRNDLDQYKNFLQQYAISHLGKYPGGWSPAVVISPSNVCGALNLSGPQCLADKRTGADCGTYNYCYFGDSTPQSANYILFAKMENAPQPYWEVCSSGLVGAASAVPTSSTDCKVGQ